MTDLEKKNLAIELASVCVFRKLIEDEDKPLSRLKDLLAFDSVLANKSFTVSAGGCYGSFVSSLAPYGCSLSEYLKSALTADENEYIVRLAQGREIPAALRENTHAELGVFSRLTKLCPDDFLRFEAENGENAARYHPIFTNDETDFARFYAEWEKRVPTEGYGLFASAGMFYLEDKEIRPVLFPDPISEDRFVGYEEQRQTVYENTAALIENKPAQNLFLYGDAGTGKSSTVKACANRFFDRGVRLIELRKDQLTELPHVMGRISRDPLKFIIFIDDLSFGKDDDSFGMLKAALEGSASGRAANAVIYATGNRRHLVKETFSEREGDDIHRGDTVSELTSLSDRFGKTVFFEKPDKALYLKIVRELAKKAGIVQNEKELEMKAEAFALGKGSRSPRAAEQFVNSLLL